MNNGRRYRFGLSFPYVNGSLGVSRRLSAYEMRRILSGKRDSMQPLYVYCEECSVYMDFTNESWKCPMCGAIVTQRSVFSQLNREIQMIDEILAELNDSEDMDE